MKEARSKRNLFVDIAFALGMLLLVVPDLFLYGSFTNSASFWLNVTNTTLDALVFFTVFFVLKREIRARQRLNEQLARANRQKTEVLQIASHDLRNPLNAMVLLASDLPEEKGDDAPGHQITSLVYQMQGIIEELIDTVALDTGGLKLRRDPVDVTACAADVVERNRRLAEHKKQKLDFTGDTPAIANVDAARLKQALDNLVSNAIKFSPPERPISVDVRPGERTVRIVVADEGPGLTEEDQSRLFGRFQRLSAQPTGGEKSTGLGLANSRRLVELNGGRIGAESDGPGLGSRFWIELPLADEGQRAS